MATESSRTESILPAAEPDGDVKIADLVAAARSRLAATPFEASTREAALILGHVLGLSEAGILARDRDVVVPRDRDRFLALLERRLSGEPVAYLLGEREFYGRAFHVDPRVLIPRPETEHLVERVLGLSLPAAPRILDVGTGSGCIAVTLAHEIEDARVIASDLAPGALDVAASNVRRHGVEERVALLAGDLTESLRLESLDLLVSNPPYIDPRDAPDLSTEVRDHEPPNALFSDDAGMEILARLMRAMKSLRSGVPVLMEFGMGQDRQLRDVAAESPLRLLEIIPDYAGIPRILVLQRR